MKLLDLPGTGVLTRIHFDKFLPEICKHVVHFDVKRQAFRALRIQLRTEDVFMKRCQVSRKVFDLEQR